MNNFATELLLKIFRYLPLSDRLICSEVCKRWHLIINSKFLLNNATVYLRNTRTFLYGFVYLVNLSLTAVTRLVLIDCDLTDNFVNVENVNALLSRLTDLTFTDCDISGSDLILVFKQCSSLKSLGLIGMDTAFAPGDFLSRTQDQIALKQTINNVTMLELRENYELTDDAFNRLASCMPNITIFKLYTAGLSFNNIVRFLAERSDKLTGLFFYSNIDKQEIDQLSRIPDLTLQELEIPSIEMSYYDLLKILKHQNNLQTLNLIQSDTFKMNKAVFQKLAILRHFKIEDVNLNIGLKEGLRCLDKLDSLHFNHVKLNGMELLHEIKCSNFREFLTGLKISVRDIAAEVLIEIIKILPNLTDVDFSFCNSVNNQVANSILKHLKKLKALNLSDCSGLQDVGMPEGDTGTNFQRLFTNFKKANSCDSMSLTEYKENMKSFIGNNCKLNRDTCTIEQLNLRFCDSISDITLLHTSNLANLRELNLSFASRNLSDHGIIALGINCPRLEVLYLQSFSMSDFGLTGLVQNTKRLTKLILKCCKNITSVSIKKLPEFCCYLRYLDISNCANIDSSVLDDFRIRLAITR